MGVARLALDAVGDVEGHARALSLEHSGHELFEVDYEILVSLERFDLVPVLSQAVDDEGDGLLPVALLVGGSEYVDDVVAVPVVDNRDFHGDVPALRAVHTY